MKIDNYTISVFCENKVGLLNRIVSVFTRRYINIESLNTSESSMKGIFRFTIVINETEVNVRKVIAQLEKQVEVLKAFYHSLDEIIYQEVALYKVPTLAFASGNKMEKLVRSYNARILHIEPEYIVIEKTGHSNETEALLRDLENIGIFEFVRSGRVAVTKPMEQLNTYLKSLELEDAN